MTPAPLPEPTATLERIRDRLADLPGVVGIVLGGSRARGAASTDSDIDVGLYYDRATRPDFTEVLRAAADLDDDGRPAGHGTYGAWGPWINGGVWLKVNGIKTDILLRDAGRVEDVVRDAARGRFTTDYQPGHPHGFVSTIYAGEVYHNRILHDPEGRLAALRALVDPYPPRLATAVITQFCWEAGFSLDNAGAPARRGDLIQVAGLAYRAVACMNQVVFAYNARYLLNEKGALAEADRLPRTPADYRRRTESALSRLSPDPEELRGLIATLSDIHTELTAWDR